jgi:malonate-semialdehyde dehydrogenase (acetylating)/methylmalonate-semialdehyde dehydrogenase
LVEQGKRDGAKAIVDGKGGGVGSGYFVSPVVLDGLPATSEVAQTEIFGPVVSLVRAETIDDAIEILNNSPYGNQASIFTTSGASARKFRYQVDAGNIGVNIGVAAPMAYFPFSGWKDSFMGVLHGQGRDGVEFYTDKKVVVERWPKEWSRKF